MMNRHRMIPVLLIDEHRRLVKTVRFDKRTYIGYPFNAIRLFNEKEVDEICVLDIDASRQQRGPDVGLIRELASECFMPLAYGGGITELQQCEQLMRMGVEKFVLGASATQPALITALVQTVGSQAVVACVDVRGEGSNAHCTTHSGTRNTGHAPLELCKSLQDQGVGELILQSIDRDGMRQGYDLELIHAIAPQLRVPVIALGGAGELAHLIAGISAGASAAASGSAFVFIGPLRAVLITYPEPEQEPT